MNTMQEILLQERLAKSQSAEFQQAVVETLEDIAL